MQELLTINTDLYRQLQKRKMDFDLFYTDFYKPIFIEQMCKSAKEGLDKYKQQYNYTFTDREKDHIVGFWNLTNAHNDRQAPYCPGCGGVNYLLKYINHAELLLPAFLNADAAFCAARLNAQAQIEIIAEQKTENIILEEIIIKKDERRKTKRNK